MGHPALRVKAREVRPEEISTKWFRDLVRDMVDTMRAEDGVGIAAPQLGESVRVSVIEFGGENERYPSMKDQALSVFVNPRLTVLDPQTEGFWEGCLSVPGLRGYVERPRRVSVEYVDEKGQSRSLEADGFLAVVLQHEFDHLDGVLYIDRVKDPARLAFLEEYRAFIVGDGDNREV
jgi:peptide deformylase